MVDEAESRLGSRLGNYMLREIIGRGGMGVVYRAEHIYIQKLVAVKVLHGYYFDQPDARERFLQEAQAAGNIDHPNIVGVTDFGEAADGTIFLVMAHVEGTPLDRLIRWEGQISLFRTLVILNQVTRALAATHAKGVVHRDMKPENIMLRSKPGRREIVREVNDEHGILDIIEPEGNYDFVTILDFGAAKFFDRSAPQIGETGVVVGTPAYMAPETASVGRADARSDVYAVGVIFYEMLTGTVPFDGDSAVAIMMKHVHEAPMLPSVCNPNAEITTEADRVIMKALSKDPDHRHQSMEDLHTDLQRCFGSTRFRREDHLTPGVKVETLRRPVPASSPPILLTNVKRRPGVTPTPPGGNPATAATGSGAPPDSTTPPMTGPRPPAARAGGQPAAAPLPGGNPIPLVTRKKSGRHHTLPFGHGQPQEDLPVPVPGLKGGKGDPPPHR